MTLGIALALCLGVLAAALCARFAAFDALLAPAMSAVKATPVASFAILVLVWLPRDAVPVCVAALMVLPVVWANVRAGILGVDGQLLELARVCRLPRGRVVRRIYVPSVLPGFAAACRSGIGFGWKAGIAAEVLTVPRASMGRMIYESKYYLQTADLFRLDAGGDTAERGHRAAAAGGAAARRREGGARGCLSFAPSPSLSAISRCCAA